VSGPRWVRARVCQALGERLWPYSFCGVSRNIDTSRPHSSVAFPACVEWATLEAVGGRYHSDWLAVRQLRQISTQDEKRKWAKQEAT